MLSIANLVYRAWAKARLRQLRPWTKTWQLDDMYSGVPGRGAQDAWMLRALHIEALLVEATPFVGASTSRC